jgi:Xaa-Pro dipeptidase
MDTKTPQQLYAAHIQELRRRYDEALEQAGCKAVLVAAGTPAAVFADDQHLPFKPNPHLLQWVPLAEHPDSILTYRPGQTPELLVYAPTDYWHRTAPVPDLVLEGPVNVRMVHAGAELLRHAKSLPARTAFLGEVRQREDSFGLRRVNPKKLVDFLHYQRSFKTPWEVANIKQASLSAVTGHRAAENCFRNGGSEYAIQNAFRVACDTTDNEMPYPAIVAINQHAATLHYQRLDRSSAENKSLLIDAGASINGYASDITRSYANDVEFSALIEAMDKLQQELCAAAQAGVDYRELHLAAHHGISQLLREAEIIDMAPEEAMATEVSRTFFPHGLGHFLGLQVHDVGALLASGGGKQIPRPDKDPYLRLTRILEPGNIITIEPGLYFIESLLEQLRQQPASKRINWPRVENFIQFGGIRIEDNIHITETGNANLTRDAFAAL